MTLDFAAVRKSVLNACALSTGFFAEDVVVKAGGMEQSCRVKIEHEQLGKRVQTTEGKPQQTDGTVDEMERIRVTFSRDPNYEFGGMPRKPNVGSALTRAVARDADRRAFTFAGEVEFEGDNHAVYIFQRQRRAVQGRRV